MRGKTAAAYSLRAFPFLWQRKHWSLGGWVFFLSAYCPGPWQDRQAASSLTTPCTLSPGRGGVLSPGRANRSTTTTDANAANKSVFLTGYTPSSQTLPAHVIAPPNSITIGSMQESPTMEGRRQAGGGPMCRKVFPEAACGGPENRLKCLYIFVP